MTKEQIRNLIGVVVVSVLVVLGAVFFGTRSQKQQAVETAVQNVASAITDASSAAKPAAVPAPLKEMPVVTSREVLVAGASVQLSFSEAKGLITYQGIDSQTVDAFFAREVEEIDGLSYTMEGSDKVRVAYHGFSVLDDQIVADWLIEDAVLLSK